MYIYILNVESLILISMLWCDVCVCVCVWQATGITRSEKARVAVLCCP